MTSREHRVAGALLPMRSFGGCDTCRRRHVKCDEGHPTCVMCHVAGFSCSGYEKSIVFSSGDFGQPGGTCFRRTISTEHERQAMSRFLTDRVPPQLALQQLMQLDDECDRIPMSQDIQICRGPFGAFRLAQAHSPSPSTHLLDDVVATHSVEASTNVGLDTDGMSSVEPIGSDNLPLDVALLESMVGMPGVSPQDHPQLVDLPLELFEIPGLPNLTDHGRKDWLSQPMLSSEIELPLEIPIYERDSYHLLSHSIGRISAVPPNISTLLQHFSTHILDLLTPFRHGKTPWHVMFLPEVKRCVAALALGETLDHASLCTFYATLTISAFSIGGITRGSMWIHEGQLYEKRAQQHCRLMLDTAYDIPKSAKYKSVLMALISMIQVSMCLNGWEDADFYFLETEKFIRLRGLKRTKSRKVRLLHHCYAFWRMFHESTYTEGRPTDHRQQIIQAIESSGFAVYSYDSPSFRLPQWTDLEKEMKEVKAQNVGENDLHIELPGTWPNTLYPEIFGLPEPWLFLLSLIVRLSKEKDVAHRHGTSDRLPLPDFLARAKTIEHFILYLHQQRESEHRSAENRPADLLTLHCLIDAVLIAIEIFFYRRVYDINACLLQEKVKSVCDCLLQCSPAQESGHGLVGFIWPAFIAACEAEDPAVRVTFVTWFGKLARLSGLHVFQRVIKMIEQIWEEKAQVSGARVTWMGMMKRGQQRSANTL